MFSVESSIMGGNSFKEVCPNVSSKWPDVFGPPTWFVLHTMAEHFPQRATDHQREACEKFIGGVPVMLPCGMCGEHFGKFTNDWATEHGSMCSGKETLKKFVCGAHNNVNRAAGKPDIDCCSSNLSSLYASQPLCVPSIPN